MRIKNSDRATDIAINVILVIIGIVCLYPLWFVLIASVSSPAAINAAEVVILPKGFNVDAYKKLLENSRIWMGYKNTIVYTALGTLVTLAIQLPCAFALSRKTAPGTKVFNMLMIITMYFSGGTIPEFLLINALGLYDSIWSLILPTAFGAFTIIIAKNYFESNIPDALYDSAVIDGCSYTSFFARIVLPLSKSIIAILSMFSIQRYWNQYMTPKIYLFSKDKFTLQQVVQQIAASVDGNLSELEGTDLAMFISKMQEQQLMKYAVVVVSIIPLILAYPLVQKHLVKGVMVGAVKG